MNIACAYLGSQSGKDWTALVTDGAIFDYSRFMDIRNRDVALPANPFRQLKVVVEQELDNRESPLREMIRPGKQQDGSIDTRIEVTRNVRTPVPYRSRRALADHESDGPMESHDFPYPAPVSGSFSTPRQSSPRRHRDPSRAINVRRSPPPAEISAAMHVCSSPSCMASGPIGWRYVADSS